MSRLSQMFESMNEDDFIKRRPLTGQITKDFRKSVQSNFNWMQNRFEIMRGIRKYSNSPEALTMNRKRSRFMLTREFIPKDGLLSRETFGYADYRKDRRGR